MSEEGYFLLRINLIENRPIEKEKLGSDHKGQLHTAIASDVVELGGWDCATMRARKNICSNVTNFFIFRLFLTK